MKATYEIKFKNNGDVIFVNENNKKDKKTKKNKQRNQLSNQFICIFFPNFTF